MNKKTPAKRRALPYIAAQRLPLEIATVPEECVFSDLRLSEIDRLDGLVFACELDRYVAVFLDR